MKYIIEIGDEFKDSCGNKLYKAEGFTSLVFDQHGLDKLKKYDAFQTYNKGYQVGYEDARKKFDLLCFEPGDVVKDKEGNKYAFVNNGINKDYYCFVRMDYQVRKLFHKYDVLNNFVKTGEKVALVYIDGNLQPDIHCCCDKREV